MVFFRFDEVQVNIFCDEENEVEVHDYHKRSVPMDLRITTHKTLEGALMLMKKVFWKR